MRLVIRAYGRPAPQGSKERGGAGQLLESSRYLPAWHQAVKIAAFEAYRSAAIPPSALPLWKARVPLYVERMHFYVTPEQCCAADTDEPVGEPDLDKLLRAVMDSLGGARRRGTARLFADDSQIKRVRDLEKFRATPEEPAGVIVAVSDVRGE